MISMGLRKTGRARQHYAHAAAAQIPRTKPRREVWQFMRDNWLSTRIFSQYDENVDRLCLAWNKHVDQPWRIMNISMRQ